MITSVTPKVAPPPGIYVNVPDNEYHQWSAWQASYITPVALGTPTAAIRYEMDAGPTPTTMAQHLGELAHRIILRPELLDADAVIELERTHENSERGAAFSTASKPEALAWAVREHPDAIPVPQGWKDRLFLINRAARANESTRRWLDATPLEHRELSIVWAEPSMGGLLCKAKADAVQGIEASGTEEVRGYTRLVRPSLAEGSVLRDLKTSKAVTHREFERDAANYGYHVQMAHYRRGLKVVFGSAPSRVCITVVHKDMRPLCVVDREVPDEYLAIGHAAWQRALKQLAESFAHDQWRGLEDEPLHAPAWV